MNENSRALGLCVGATSVSMVMVERTDAGVRVLLTRRQAHGGECDRTLRVLLSDIPDPDRMAVAATGRRFRRHLDLDSISEPEAVELAAAHVLSGHDRGRTVISAGGETFMAYRLDARGRVVDIRAGNKCASGTGEFLIQQLRRVGVEPHELDGLDLNATPHPVSGRCSVFCKSDCTHALNKGVPRLEIIAGLTRMMAGKCLELVRRLPAGPTLLVGGCAANKFLVHHLRQEIPGLIVPIEAGCFEALGAALWALDNRPRPFPGPDRLFVRQQASFSTLPPLAGHLGQVRFESVELAAARPGDELILGLDVGSTTTKGVLMRRADKAVVASVYLRTLGDPIGASRRVYAGLDSQLAAQLTAHMVGRPGADARAPVCITALGVTGSGRRIAGLHACTPGVINEIVAHAAAAVHFDPEVDTIFEIGGQDAKYTWIVNGAPADYAMNEACGAGTGSFLEESALESLGADVRDIASLALAADHPPNFSDQCAAFISSDIKTALQENFPQDDILAGLVYSVCMNYQNRVKGHRPVGRKVFMQGGVCYNRAVPVAMAALTGKDIVVPPEPGLMGAFGVALVAAERLEQGELAPGDYRLDELAGRAVRYREPFRCKGGGTGCDRRCEIARIEVSGRTHPFGGVCNLYEGAESGRLRHDAQRLNLIDQRTRRLFRDLTPPMPDSRPTIGLNRSFLVHAWFPFFNAFFAELGWRCVLPDLPDQDGQEARGAAFCHPAELAHGYFASLLRLNPDALFLPHITSLPDDEPQAKSRTCVLLQGEAFYLRTAFGPQLNARRIFSPRLDFARSPETDPAQLLDVLRPLAVELDTRNRASGRAAAAALDAAFAAQSAFRRDLRELCRPILEEQAAKPDGLAVVLFGRPYNALAPEANKGIPAKFASRGVAVVPLDGLPLDGLPLPGEHNMYWGTGRTILRAAALTAGRPELYGAYVTNFSCGPDSFLLTYFRDVMGRKPSLTLELDSHTADAGIETRVEAFLDIARHDRKARGVGMPRRPSDPPTMPPARLEYRSEGKRSVAQVRTSDGQLLPLADPRVQVVLPSLGLHGTRFLAGAFARADIRAKALPPADESALKLGRGHSTCKECLPLQTTVGTLLTHLRERPADEVTVYFMPSADGPCRFGQYAVFSRLLMDKGGHPNATVISPCAADGYAGLGDRLTLALFRAVAAGDMFTEMQAVLQAAAKDPVEALAVLEEEGLDLARHMGRDWPVLARRLNAVADRLRRIPLRVDPRTLPRLALVGEIYVRHDPISLQDIIGRLARQGFVVHTAPVLEWMFYTDWLIRQGLSAKPTLGFHIRRLVKARAASAVRKRLSASGLILSHPVDVQTVTSAGAHFISRHLHGEAILTVGSAFHEILNPACGVLSIGPFGCMPSRLAESILAETFTVQTWQTIHSRQTHIPPDARLPFLSIETDGGPFPPLIEARLEAFCLQAERMHRVWTG